nr:hypothetical protein [Tanacetum cinerariifolium]
MSADVARGHGGDGGGDDRPPPYQVPTRCGGYLGNRGKGAQKPNLGGRRAGRLHTCQETQNLRLKAITDKSGPVPIRFDVDDRETLMSLGDHAAHWANYLGVVAKIGTQFDLRPHMESDRWPQINTGIQQHLQKIYNGKKAALKERYWVPKEDGSYDLERIRRGRPSHISEANWDEQLAFWNDPKNLARVAQNKQNQAKSKVVCRQGSRSITALRDMHRGHIPGVGRVLPGQGTVIPPSSQSTHSTDIARLKKHEKLLTKQVNMFMSGSGGCGDDKPGDDEDGGEDEEDEDDSSWATCCPGKPFTVALNCLTETMWARRCHPGRYPIRAFSFDVSQATCRSRNLPPVTSCSGFPEIVAGENGGGGGKKKKKKSTTKVLIGSCLEYEFSSLSVGVGKVHTQDGGVHKGNNGNDGATKQVYEVTNDGNPNETCLESIMKEAPSTYANKLSHTSLTKANPQKLDANVPNDVDFDIWLLLASVHEIEVDACNGFSNNLIIVVPNLEGPRYIKETIRVEYEWEPPRCGTCLIFGHSVDDCLKGPKQVVNRVDKGNGGSSRVDDEGFIGVKKEKSCGNDGGIKKFKPISMKPKTQYRPKVNQLTKRVSRKMAYSIGNGTFSLSNSFEALNVDDSVTEEVESEGKCVLVNDDGNPLAKVDYSGDHDSNDEVEPLVNEMTSYLASKSSGLDMVLIAYWNNEEKHTGMLNTNTTQMMMICMKVMKFLTIFNLYVIIWISRFEVERRNRLLDIASLVV